MSNEVDYVPAIRDRASEVKSIQRIRDDVKNRIRPILMPDSNTFFRDKKLFELDSPLKRAIRENEIILKRTSMFSDEWAERSFLFDINWLADWCNRGLTATRLPDMLNKYLRQYRNKGLSIIPITGINRSPEFQKLILDKISLDSNGVGFRILRPEFSKANFPNVLMQFCRDYRVNIENVDLILDSGYLGTGPPIPPLRELLKNIPDLDLWRSLIIIGGSLPKDLRDFDPGNHPVPRIEWQLWKNQRQGLDSSTRFPIFGDYLSQHAEYVEPLKNMYPSASVRWAAKEYHWIMRGHGTNSKLIKKGEWGDQFHYHAQLLVDDEDHDFDRNHCWGDKFIYEKSQANDHFGGLPDWLQVGMTHHLTLVAEQVSDILHPVPATEALPATAVF